MNNTILYYRSKTTGIYVHFTDLTSGKVVANGGNNRFAVGVTSNNWIPYTDIDQWELVSEKLVAALTPYKYVFVR